MIIGGKIELFWKLKNYSEGEKSNKVDSFRQCWSSKIGNDIVYGCMRIVSTLVQMVFFCKIIISWKRKTQCSNKPHAPTNPALPTYCTCVFVPEAGKWVNIQAKVKLGNQRVQVLVDLNEVHLSFEKCKILTPDIRTQPQTSLESL